MIRFISSYILPKLSVKRVPFKPGVVGIEITNNCVLDCLECPRHKMSRKVGYMAEDIFREAIEQVASVQDSVNLHFFGDPLMAKDLPKFVEYAHRKKIKTEISVKGNLLNEKVSEELIKAGLDQILISWYGLTKKDFEKVQRGAKYEKTRRNIENFLKIRANMGVSKPKVIFELLVRDPTKKELNQFLKGGLEKVDGTPTKVLHSWGGESDKVLNFLDRETNTTNKPCPSLWRGEFNILFNGDVVPCCADYDGKYILGNIMEENILDIWNNERMRNLRRLHTAGQKNKVELCKLCNLPEEWWSLSAIIRRKIFKRKKR